MKIARELTVVPQKVYEALLELNRAKILVYVPRSRTPYMYVPTAREESRHVMIGRAVYEDRYRIMQTRTEAVIKYASFEDDCRVKYMLGYFGETDSGDCGRCDVCREARKRSSKEASLSAVEIQTRILDTLRENGPARIVSLSRSVGVSDTDLRPVLSWLISEGYITLDDTWYSIP